MPAAAPAAADRTRTALAHKGYPRLSGTPRTALDTPRRGRRARAPPRDLAAEQREGLRHLDAHRARSQDQQVARALREVEQGLVREIGHSVKAGQEGDSRPAADGQHDPPPLDLHRIRRYEPRPGLQDLAAQPAIALCGVGRRDRGDSTPQMRADSRPIDLGRRQNHAVAPGASRRARRMGAGEQRLARHAARVQALAAHRALLDQGDAQTQPRRHVRDRQPGRSRADDDEVAPIHAPSWAPSWHGAPAAPPWAGVRATPGRPAAAGHPAGAGDPDWAGRRPQARLRARPLP